ncbi:hypothetical protein [Parapedobacter tibetensis]|uniref:hypothetical protein n=1 Tax=Parapedobacter tibetensis TaxID=2972951 RepID=UPI00214DD5CD|nr:hypothetical protein [Parapedobacter tibetensis]
MRKVKTDKVNYAIPGDPMTPEELQQMIHEAENGKFNSMHAVKQKIEAWKRKYAR